jgi:hypothetical protein
MEPDAACLRAAISSSFGIGRAERGDAGMYMGKQNKKEASTGQAGVRSSKLRKLVRCQTSGR